MPHPPLAQFLRQRPFIPFKIHVVDGTSYEIRHPDLVLTAPGYIIIGVPPATPQPWIMMEHHEVVDMSLISRLEPIALGNVQAN